MSAPLIEAELYFIGFARLRQYLMRGVITIESDPHTPTTKAIYAFF